MIVQIVFQKSEAGGLRRRMQTSPPSPPASERFSFLNTSRPQITSKDGFQPASLRKFSSSCCKRLPARGAWSASSLDVGVGIIGKHRYFSYRGKETKFLPMLHGPTIHDFQISFLEYIGHFPR